MAGVASIAKYPEVSRGLDVEWVKRKKRLAQAPETRGDPEETRAIGGGKEGRRKGKRKRNKKGINE